MTKRIVALDFGLKRTGIAITDEMNIIASGLTTVESAKLIPYLKTLIEQKNVGPIVLGEPKRLNNTDTHISQNVRLLFDVLTKEFPGISIQLHDERFTSKMASSAIHASGITKSRQKNKELIDEVSATILLQSYMQANR